MEGGMRRVATRMGEMEEPIAIPICGCGVPAHLRTSWSNDNPGRRFFACKNHDSLVYQPCRFFIWFDPPMPPRAKIVLLGLLKRIRANECFGGLMVGVLVGFLGITGTHIGLLMSLVALEKWNIKIKI
ncbi:hypothetical protein GQ457_06G006060 [Hibiscus cannabinus]